MSSLFYFNTALFHYKYCCIKEHLMKRNRLTKETVQEQIYSTGKKIKIIGEYKGALTKTQFECEVCGHKWETLPNNIKSKNRKCSCPACYGKRNGNHPLTKEEVEKRINIKKIKLVGDWVNTNTKTQFGCVGCGYNWETIASNVLTKRDSGCPSCARKRTLIAKHKADKKRLEEDFKKYGEHYSSYRLTVDLLTARVNRRYTKFNNNRDENIDHIFSVREGYERGIDPLVLSSPINLRLMTFSDNIKKGKKSDITSDELYNRYGDWINDNPDYEEILFLPLEYNNL